MGTLANSEDQDEMQHDAAFNQDLHSLLRLKQPSGTDIDLNLDNSTYDPLKYTMSSLILIESLCMGKSIRIQRFNSHIRLFLKSCYNFYLHGCHFSLSFSGGRSLL